MRGIPSPTTLPPRRPPGEKACWENDWLGPGLQVKQARLPPADRVVSERGVSGHRDRSLRRRPTSREGRRAEDHAARTCAARTGLTMRKIQDAPLEPACWAEATERPTPYRPIRVSARNYSPAPQGARGLRINGRGSVPTIDSPPRFRVREKRARQCAHAGTAPSTFSPASLST